MERETNKRINSVTTISEGNETKPRKLDPKRLEDADRMLSKITRVQYLETPEICSVFVHLRIPCETCVWHGYEIYKWSDNWTPIVTHESYCYKSAIVHNS